MLVRRKSAAPLYGARVGPVLKTCLPIPRGSKRHIAFSHLFYRSEGAHSAAPPFQIEPALLDFDMALRADMGTAFMLFTPLRFDIFMLENGSTCF